MTHSSTHSPVAHPEGAYFTPPHIATLIAEVLIRDGFVSPELGSVGDLHAGGGALLRPFFVRGFRVWGEDIHPRLNGFIEITEPDPDRDYTDIQALVLNPPFGIQVRDPKTGKMKRRHVGTGHIMAALALPVPVVAALLPIGFLGGAKRHGDDRLHGAHTLSVLYHYPHRIRFIRPTGEQMGSPSHDHALFVWDRRPEAAGEETRLRWLR